MNRKAGRKPQGAHAAGTALAPAAPENQVVRLTGQPPGPGQDAAAADSDLRQLAERAMRHAQVVLAGRQSDQAGSYLPVRDGQALAGAELDAWVDRANDNAALRLMGRGVAYLLKQQELAANSFNAWLKDRGLDRGEAYRAIRVARMFAGLDEGVVHALAGLDSEMWVTSHTALFSDSRKLMDLASLPPAEIERLVNLGDFEQLAQLPRARFREAVQAIKRLAGKYDELAEHCRQIEEQNQYRGVEYCEGLLPVPASAARIEGAALARVALDAITRMGGLFSRLDAAPELGSMEDVAAQEAWRAGLAPLAAGLDAVRALAASQLARLRAAAPEILEVAAQHPLAPGEAEHSQAMFARMAQAASAEAPSAQPPPARRRGRPRNGGAA